MITATTCKCIVKVQAKFVKLPSTCRQNRKLLDAAAVKFPAVSRVSVGAVWRILFVAKKEEEEMATTTTTTTRLCFER